MLVDIQYYVAIGTLLFFVGITGIMVSAKNFISVLICTEVMLLGININFMAVAGFIDIAHGILASIIVLTMAAVEAAIGLAILMAYHDKVGHIKVGDYNNIT